MASVVATMLYPLNGFAIFIFESSIPETFLFKQTVAQPGLHFSSQTLVLVAFIRTESQVTDINSGCLADDEDGRAGGNIRLQAAERHFGLCLHETVTAGKHQSKG